MAMSSAPGTLHLGEVAFASDRFGRLLGELRALGLLESAVIVCTSDHGELFGVDGRMCHGGEPHEELLHVPLLMRFPDAELSAGTFEQRVDLRDVKPTLLGYLGIDDETSTGRSLLPLIRGETSELPAAEPWRPLLPRLGDLEEQVLPGQDPAQTERLVDELRALGYID